MLIDLKEAAEIIGCTRHTFLKNMNAELNEAFFPVSGSGANTWQFDKARLEFYQKQSEQRQGQAYVLTDEELNYTLAHFNHKANKGNATAAKYGLLIALSHYTGMRCVEISKLTLGDIVTPDYTLRDKTQLKARHTKKDKPREVALNNVKLLPFLENYLPIRLGQTDMLSQPLFANRKGLGYDRRTLAHMFKKAYIQVNISEASSHSGRRWFITNLLRKNVPMKTVQELAGHTDASMTSKYYQPTQQEKLDAVAML